jgi:Ctr copper transporter family
MFNRHMACGKHEACAVCVCAVTNRRSATNLNMKPLHLHSAPARAGRSRIDQSSHGMDMDMDMDMSMSMTFSKLGAYKVKVLWDWWDVQQPFEYFLSCLFVVALAIGYHAMRRLQSRALRDLIVAKVSTAPFMQ